MRTRVDGEGVLLTLGKKGRRAVLALATVGCLGIGDAMQSVSAQSIDFGGVKNLSNTPEGSGDSHIAVDGRYTYVIWMDCIPGVGCEILFKRSTDRGATFEDSLVLSDIHRSSLRPRIAISGRNVYVVWQEGPQSLQGGLEKEIMFTASRDRGETFAAPTNLSNLKVYIPNSVNAEIAAFGDNVYVAWYGNIEMCPLPSCSFTKADTYFIASTDRGKTFGSAKNLSKNDGNSYILLSPQGPEVGPQIAAFDNRVYVVWDDDTSGDFDILFRASEDRGATFGKKVNLSDASDLGGATAPDYLGRLSSLPSIAVWGRNVYVAWSQGIEQPGRDRDVLIRSSTNRGVTFARAKNISEGEDPKLIEGYIVTVAHKNNVYVAWAGGVTHTIAPDVSANITEVFFAASTDRGRSFSEPVNLSETPEYERYSLSPQMAARDNKVYVAWSESWQGVLPPINFVDVWMRASTDSGDTFGDTQSVLDISNIPGVPELPGAQVNSVALSSNRVYLTWNDFMADNLLYRPDIWFSTGILLPERAPF